MRRRDERGNVMVIAALAMTALVLFAALAVDGGIVWLSRTESQNAADSAALAAANKMIQQSGTGPQQVEIDDAIDEGQEFADANPTVGEAVDPMTGTGGVNVRDGDFTFGDWNLQTRTLDTAIDTGNPDEVTAVRVTVLMDGTANNRSPTLFAGVGGITGFEVKNTSTAYLGFAGTFENGEFDLPIAIDSCDLASDEGCGSDFCATAASPPNECDIEEHVGSGAEDDDVSCLDFSPTGYQNACWTLFSDESSINANDLRDLVGSGNPDDVKAGDQIGLDNGDKTNALHRIHDYFYGIGFPQRGVDRYPNDNPAFDDVSDSWVVKLPVVECQDIAHCSGPSTFAITGGVCFEIREVVDSGSDKGIRGRFLCPNSSDANDRQLFDDHCRHDSPTDPRSGPGGCNFGLRADRPVLVQ